MEKREPVKERILHAASDLFYREGIRAVGIDRIIAESGVAKASFYRSFATKDDLVVAYLEQKFQRSLQRIEAARSRHPDDPLGQLRHLFGQLAPRIAEPDFRGCPFMNAAVEFPDTSHPGYVKSTECCRTLWSHVTEIAREAGARDPEALSAQLEIAYRGTIMTSYLYKGERGADHFLHIAMLLIEDHIPHGTRR
ncbi:TetR family transcriptional regulator [Gordoniibacillus kamchatkensis]|uniref:TetR family transcriptional regulator n=1 Tax=Gordoniibacillus kamchatkensis TaxID=1590651 RepID=A0ABR5AJL8_9BACL|nr:TetR/AcrR family transcriptional regulator [Paenibacillus sp. VKM B-2647]KIL41033.1 TetR family transcriptional regulator [Paenibacillus sp. VKM B-2647]